MTNIESLSPAVQDVLRRPSSQPPAGVLSNLDNPTNGNEGAIALAVVCISLVAVSVYLRLYSRLFVVKQLRIEDYLGLIAVLPYIGIAWTFFDYALKVGFFVHQWDLRGQVIIDVAINSFVLRIVYALSMIITKTAVLLDWQRIFVLGQTNRTFFWISTFVIVLNIILYTVGIVVSIFACRPIETWRFWIKGKCIDRKSFEIVNAAFNVAIDCFILLLPQRIIWTLTMSSNRRLGMSVVFSIGLLTIASAAGRLYSAATLDYLSRRDLLKPFDTTYSYSRTLIWVQCETTCLFLVFCAPALPQVFAKSSIISRIALSMRSWTRPGRSPSYQSEPRLWPPTIGSIRTKPRRKPTGLTTAEDETQTQGSSIQLTTIPEKQIASVQDSHKAPVDVAIVRTVEFYSSDNTASKAQNSF